MNGGNGCIPPSEPARPTSGRRSTGAARRCVPRCSCSPAEGSSPTARSPRSATPYRWTGEAEASTVARSFARALEPARPRRHRAHPRAHRAPQRRAPGPHRASKSCPRRPTRPSARAYTRAGTSGRARSSRSSTAAAAPVAVLRLRFALDERCEALASGRREVMLAGLGAGPAAGDRLRRADLAADRAPASSGSPPARCWSPPASPARRCAGAGATRSACWPARSTRSAARCERCRGASTGSC